jgi:tripartite-type tricarboxylate transporter receptor subunit TctC
MKARHLIFFTVVLMLGFGTLLPFASFAQKYPDRPIQLVIPNVAGAQMDISARLLAAELEKSLGTTIVPVNKPGAATTLGTDTVARAKKDGYTLLFAGTSALIFAPITNPETVQYDPAKDLEPLGLYYYFPNTITVKSDSPWKTFPEFVDYAKKNPGKIRISTTGVASGPHFMVEMIQAITGAQFTHVPFKGGESVVTAVLGGHVEATCDNVSKLKPHVDAGKLRFLVITNKMSVVPDVPTITELGYKQGLLTGWFALYAPAGIPEEAKKVLVPAIEKAVKSTKSKIDQMGNLCEYKSPSELKKMWEEEYKQIYQIAVKIGLRKP